MHEHLAYDLSSGDDGQRSLARQARNLATAGPRKSDKQEHMSYLCACVHRTRSNSPKKSFTIQLRESTGNKNRHHILDYAHDETCSLGRARTSLNAHPPNLNTKSYQNRFSAGTGRHSPRHQNTTLRRAQNTARAMSAIVEKNENTKAG